jgi:hypothetical protein
MFDEDDEKRFPRLTLWQFTKGFFRASDWKLDSWASARIEVVIHSLEREVDHGSLLFSRSSGAGRRLR